MLAPLIYTASGCTWPTAIIAAGLGLSACWVKHKLTGDKILPVWLRRLQNVWAIPVMVRMLTWVSACWPDSGKWPAIALGVFGAIAALRGRETIVRFSAVSRYFLIVLLGGVILSGIKGISLDNLIPSWQLNGGDLITVCLLPALCGEDELKKAGNEVLLLAAAAASVVTVGVLSPGYASDAAAPFYELSRNLTVLGIAERFESVVSTAMTIGLFVTLCFLLTNSCGEKVKHGMIIGILATILYASNACVDSRFVAAGTALIWVLLPTITALWIKIKKYEKNA